MGCDIHLVVEARENNGAWALVTPPASHRETHFDQDNDRFLWACDRDYASFAILADVRNGYGADFIPLSQARGRPTDLSFKPGDDNRSIWLGDHSFSHCTLAELHAYPHWDLYPDRAQTLRELVRDLEALGRPPHDVRLVFGFDS